MLSCHQATRLMSEAHERSLSFREKAVLKVHKIICVGCRNFEKSIDTIHRAMQDFASGKHDNEQ